MQHLFGLPDVMPRVDFRRVVVKTKGLSTLQLPERLIQILLATPQPLLESISDNTVLEEI